MRSCLVNVLDVPKNVAASKPGLLVLQIDLTVSQKVSVGPNSPCKASACYVVTARSLTPDVVHSNEKVWTVSKSFDAMPLGLFLRTYAVDRRAPAPRVVRWGESIFRAKALVGA